MTSNKEKQILLLISWTVMNHAVVRCATSAHLMEPEEHATIEKTILKIWKNFVWPYLMLLLYL